MKFNIGDKILTKKANENGIIVDIELNGDGVVIKVDMSPVYNNIMFFSPRSIKLDTQWVRENKISQILDENRI